MNLSLLRRSIAGVLFASLGLGTSAVAAQDWPSKAVRLIVPAGAGSAPDVIARLLAEQLGREWGQSVFVDNRPGAGGIPGMSALARSAGDGYTVGFVPAAMGTITPLIYKNPQFDPPTDLTSVATVGVSPLMFVVPAEAGITSLADLASQGQARPGSLNLAVPQLNSLPHLAGEMVNKLGGMGLFTVPYPSAPAAITAALAGDAAVTIDGIPGVIPHVRSGRLRALAVTSAERLPEFATVPTVAESFPGYEALGWFQIMVPASTPDEINDRINRDVNQLTHSPDFVARLADMGIYPRRDSVSQAGEFFSTQQQRMKQFVDDLGIQPQ